MATYAIGDVQGCFDELMELLEIIQFDEKSDTLWFVGDLVNRGPKSLETLRFVKSLGDRAITVLGNHDIHLLTIAYGVNTDKGHETLRPILRADDREELIAWLRRQKLAHFDAQLGIGMVHAGLPPQWTFEQTVGFAHEFETVLQSDAAGELLSILYGDDPACWHEQLEGVERLRFIVNACTRLRFCDHTGEMDFAFKGEIGGQPAGLQPWFEVDGRKSSDDFIVFGHWSALGFMQTSRLLSIDTGCLWGGELTAVRIDTEEKPRFFVQSHGHRSIGS